jgi:hypothetical protein
VLWRICPNVSVQGISRHRLVAGFFLNIPETVSPQAQAFLRTLTDPALRPAFPVPHDIEGWKRLQESAEADGRARSERLLKHIADLADARAQVESRWRDGGQGVTHCGSS